MPRQTIRERFDTIVAFAEVERFVDTPVKRYSSGMVVRLAFAIAAHLEPDILLVDEVLAVGDADFQKKCIGKMESVSHEEGRTVLLVSHSMTTVQAVCRQAVYLEHGRTAGVLPTEEAVRRYLGTESGNRAVFQAPGGPGRHPGAHIEGAPAQEQPTARANVPGADPIPEASA